MLFTLNLVLWTLVIEILELCYTFVVEHFDTKSLMLGDLNVFALYLKLYIMILRRCTNLQDLLVYLIIIKTR